ncbi:MAG: glutamine-hydrolyzing carbamoyl-phosphate synthase small subunit [Gammaproteobacteria bacterium]|nr:glutamine-hydrolyzing carbamoyl-phosphate synthase small subunit [Gammaproteobacteria bacterium]
MSSQVPAILVLEDGTIFRGYSVGVAGIAVGEVVFNTAMTGYQEILTDPSYAKQIVTLTYPHIGNTGANDDDMESGSVWSEGLVVRDVPNTLSNRRSEYSLRDFLLKENVVAITSIDTRMLTRILRTKGALAGCIIAGDQCDAAKALDHAHSFPGLKAMDLAKEVTCSAPYTWRERSWDPVLGYERGNHVQYRVVAYDFGVKRNILRLMVDRHIDVIVVPADTTVKEALRYEPDGIFLSNGPGDPEPCSYAIEAIQGFFKLGIPVFGICLGLQLLALAAGAKTVKMNHGHHGANHPVQDIQLDRVVITSQNHGFCVDAEDLPKNLQVTHISLFDNSLQGLRHKEVPAFGFQGHPEASPGPQDCQYLFDQFVDLMHRCQQKSA